MSQDRAGGVDQPEEDSSRQANQRHSRRFFPAQRKSSVALITDVKRSPVENWKHRKRMYAILQGSRIPFLLASAVTYMWLHNVILSVILFTISVPLPWIAVVIANGAGEPKDPREKQVYKPAAIRAKRQEALENGLHGLSERQLGHSKNGNNHSGELDRITPENRVVHPTIDHDDEPKA